MPTEIRTVPGVIPVGFLCCFIKSLMGSRSRMNDERLGIAYIGKIGEDFEVVDEFSGRLKSVFQFTWRKMEPAPFGRYFSCSL